MVCNIGRLAVYIVVGMTGLCSHFGLSLWPTLAEPPQLLVTVWPAASNLDAMVAAETPPRSGHTSGAPSSADSGRPS